MNSRSVFHGARLLTMCAAAGAFFLLVQPGKSLASSGGGDGGSAYGDPTTSGWDDGVVRQNWSSSATRKPVKRVQRKKPRKIRKTTKPRKKPNDTQTVRRYTSPGLSPRLPIYSANEIVIAFDPATPDQVIDQVAADYGVQRLDDAEIALLEARIVKFRFNGPPVPQTVLDMDADPRTLFGQFNYLYGVAATAGLQYAVAKMGVDRAHATARGDGVKVAVIDSGVARNHPALAGAVLDEFDPLGKALLRADGHGTAVASIVAARNGMTGVAPGATVLSVRAFGAVEKGAVATGDTYSLLRGVDWAVDRGARVLNLSFAGPKDDAFERILFRAYESGVVSVAAAGNLGPDAPPAYPGAYDMVIAASATDDRDRIYKFANQGEYVVISAPGVEILTAGGRNGYGFNSGTSMAAAHITGAIALILQKLPDLSPDGVMATLQAAARDVGAAGRDPAFGFGILDASTALGVVATQ